MRRSATLGRSRTFVPPTKISPLVGSTRRLKHRSSVVFPDPLSPTSATLVPAATSRLTPSSATTSPYRCTTSRAVERERLATRLPLGGVCHAPKLPGAPLQPRVRNARPLARDRPRYHLRMLLQPPATLWTIGHSTHSLDEFLELLARTRSHASRMCAASPARARIRSSIPTRSAPSLAEHEIGYTPMLELGGRRKPRPDSPHTAWRNESFRGYADYMDTPEFASAAEALAALGRAPIMLQRCAPRACGGAAIAR